MPLIITGCLCVAIAGISKVADVFVIVGLAVLTKFIAFIVWNAFDLWSAELLPTCFRTTGLGVVDFVSRVTIGCLTLLTASTAKLWIICTVLGVSAILVSCVGFKLPETNPTREKPGDITANVVSSNKEEGDGDLEIGL